MLILCIAAYVMQSNGHNLKMLITLIVEFECEWSYLTLFKYQLSN